MTNHTHNHTPWRDGFHAVRQGLATCDFRLATNGFGIRKSPWRDGFHAVRQGLATCDLRLATNGSWIRKSPWRDGFHAVRRHAAWLLLPALLLAGCTSFDPDRARHSQTTTFTNHLQHASDQLLQKPLTLANCVAIAHTNNYSARKADLDTELMRIGKNVAFTAFLPNLSATAGYTIHGKQPNVMSEKRFGQASLDANVPIFLPSAWFLYAATRHGYKAAELAADFTRQTIAFETTTAYYQVLVLQDTVAALESQLKATQQNAERLAGLAQEGLLTTWEGDQAKLLASMRQTELDVARRQLDVAKGELLVTMGLSPLALSSATLHLRDSALNSPSTTPQKEILQNSSSFDDNSPSASPRLRDSALNSPSTADLVLSSLETHPLLSIADRQVVMQEHSVRQAFTAFLPILNLGFSKSWTGNDFADHASNWTALFGGTWNLFSGFANSARYKAAKAERHRSELERESTFLQIMIQIVAAEANLHDARDEALLSRQAYEVAAAKYQDYDAKSREGLIPTSDALDARALMDLAQVAMVKSRYQEQIALAALHLAMGHYATTPPGGMASTPSAPGRGGTRPSISPPTPPGGTASTPSATPF